MLKKIFTRFDKHIISILILSLPVAVFMTACNPSASNGTPQPTAIVTATATVTDEPQLQTGVPGTTASRIIVNAITADGKYILENNEQIDLPVQTMLGNANALPPKITSLMAWWRDNYYIHVVATVEAEAGMRDAILFEHRAGTIGWGVATGWYYLPDLTITVDTVEFDIPTYATSYDHPGMYNPKAVHDPGTYWFGLHITDKNGVMMTESACGLTPVQIIIP